MPGGAGIIPLSRSRQREKEKPPMKMLFAALRLVVAIGIVVAIVATFFDTATRATINPFNFFGYFTLQSNILAAIVLAIAAAATLTGRPQSPALMLARGSVTTYLIIVGIVYNTLLVGLPGGGGVALPWANFVLHVASPIYILLDWLLFSDREPLPWKRFWVVFIYPFAWLIVVLIRGATDGWVPYPFLDPATGYASVTAYSVGIAVGIALFGAIVWGLSRVRAIPE